MNAPEIRYDRELLVEVLIYHARTATAGCQCGWADLGASHPEHVADIYEQSITAKGGSVTGDREEANFLRKVRAKADELLQWTADWRDGLFEPTHHALEWPVELTGLAGSTDDLARDALRLADRLERAEQVVGLYNARRWLRDLL